MLEEFNAYAKIDNQRKATKKYCNSSHGREKNKRSRLKLKYNLTLEEYEELKKNQEEKCWICGVGDSKLCVDHCHKTNKVRKLLCTQCNLALGLFKDNIKSLEKAVQYLKDHK